MKLHTVMQKWKVYHTRYSFSTLKLNIAIDRLVTNRNTYTKKHVWQWRYINNIYEHHMLHNGASTMVLDIWHASTMILTNNSDNIWLLAILLWCMHISTNDCTHTLQDVIMKYWQVFHSKYIFSLLKRIPTSSSMDTKYKKKPDIIRHTTIIIKIATHIPSIHIHYTQAKHWQISRPSLQSS
jgi:hypothetical protein